jgi:prepilin-type processing-associated H-X9-DG protein
MADGAHDTAKINVNQLFGMDLGSKGIRLSPQRAFSRTELLVSISVLLVLGILGYVGFSKASVAAKNKTCQSNLKTLFTGFSGFVTASNKLPSAARTGNTEPNDWIHWQPDRYFEESAIAPFIPAFGTKILQCPLDQQVRYRDFPFSYTMNVSLERLPPARLANKNTLILLFEESSPNDGSCVAGESSDRLTTRHAGQSNAGFLDGRVESMTEPKAILRDHIEPRLRR